MITAGSATAMVFPLQGWTVTVSNDRFMRYNNYKERYTDQELCAFEVCMNKFGRNDLC